MTLQEAIFGAVYRPPQLAELDLFEEGIDSALYLQLLEETRKEWLVKFGLDPAEYAFEREELPSEVDSAKPLQISEKLQLVRVTKLPKRFRERLRLASHDRLFVDESSGRYYVTGCKETV